MDRGGNTDLTEELWDAWQLSPRALAWLLRYHSCSEQNTVPCTCSQATGLFVHRRPLRWTSDLWGLMAPVSRLVLYLVGWEPEPRSPP